MHRMPVCGSTYALRENVKCGSQAAVINQLWVIDCIDHTSDHQAEVAYIGYMPAANFTGLIASRLESTTLKTHRYRLYSPKMIYVCLCACSMKQRRFFQLRACTFVSRETSISHLTCSVENNLSISFKSRNGSLAPNSCWGTPRVTKPGASYSIHFKANFFHVK